MANTYKNIIITPNISNNTSDPRIQFSGGNTTSNTDINLYVYPLSNGTLSFEGSAGQLFSITNDLANLLFSVSDVSGIPSLEIYANGLVSVIPVTGNVVFGNTTTGILVNTTNISIRSNSTVNSTITPTNLSLGGQITANGGVGSAGQFLTSGGAANVYWSTISGVNTAAQYSWSNTQTFNSNLVIGSTGEIIIDSAAGIWANGTFGTNGQILTSNGTAVYWSNSVNVATLTANNSNFLGGVSANNIRNSTINYVIDNGTSVLPTGVIGNGIYVPFNCTISNVTMIADVSGNIVINILKGNYTSYPTVSTSIVAAAKPTISSNTKSQDTTLSGWSTSLSSGDILQFNVESVNLIKQVIISLGVLRT